METKKDDVSSLHSLGSGKTTYATNEVRPDLLEVFKNQFSGRDYTVKFSTKEFTSNCPRTGQPDFAEIEVEYVPDDLLLETKGVKLYFFSYRNVGTFMETLTNNMLSHFVEACKPRSMTVTAHFAPRGGIPLVVSVSYQKPLDVL